MVEEAARVRVTAEGHRSEAGPISSVSVASTLPRRGRADDKITITSHGRWGGANSWSLCLGTFGNLNLALVMKHRRAAVYMRPGPLHPFWNDFAGFWTKWACSGASSANFERSWPILARFRPTCQANLADS